MDETGSSNSASEPTNDPSSMPVPPGGNGDPANDPAGELHTMDSDSNGTRTILLAGLAAVLLWWFS
jgi:hypothetical protein